MKLKITVHGVSYEVDVEVLDEGKGFSINEGSAAIPAATVNAPVYSAPVSAPVAPRPAVNNVSNQANAILSPVAGTILEIKCKVGQTVKFGDPLLVVEAMKMHTSMVSDREGTIKNIAVKVGEAVREGQSLVEFA